jgi:methylmalonyl-CoA mutase, N-terminal domain
MNQTRSGISVKEVYWPSELPSDLNEAETAKKYLGAPGDFPFTRGVQKDMYRGRVWTMRQYAGFGSAEESNLRYQTLLAQGALGLSVAFDLPTQLGYDPDHERSLGEVGKVGVSISTLEDMRTLLKGIDLSKTSTSMTINATANILFSFYVALAEEQGFQLSALRGTVQNDVLKEYIARGNYIYPPAGALRLATDLFAWSAKHTPKWNPISISGYHIREAGSTAVQELAFTFANAICYTEEAIKQGLSIDQFAGQLSFFFNVHNDFFEEVAKFRAARRIWATLMRDRFKAKEARSQMLRFHAQTAGSTLTAQQPHNNVVRVTLQALAAVLGGTQSLHTNSLDEALSLPTEEAACLALRTQQIIANESNVTATVDPLGGSWFVENLTSELEKRVLKYLKKIDQQGGTVRCIESGFIQNEILNSAYLDQQRMETGDLKGVGVNCFTEEVGEPPQVHRVSLEGEKEAVKKLKAFKKNRSLGAVNAALSALQAGAQGNANLQALVLNAAKKQATLGEISDVLRNVFGTFQGYSGF